jgi:leader peptidase (prepilin peptidase) / N-methyltransferase
MEFPALFYSLVFLFGLALGSFLNVVIYRRGGGSLRGRSRCLSCGKNLTPAMLVPVLSYAIQRGHCAYCGARVSLQYPLVELAMGGALLLVAMNHGLADQPLALNVVVKVILDAVAFGALIAIVVYDFRHKIIPDRFSAVFAASGFLLLALALYERGLYTDSTTLLPFVPWWADLLAGPALALPFALLWYFSGGRAMGFGDAKLSWGIGWYLGFTKGFTALVFSFWIAFLPSLALLLLSHRRFTMKSEVPFGPFLVLGTILVYITGWDITNWTMLEI